MLRTGVVASAMLVPHTVRKLMPSGPTLVVQVGERDSTGRLSTRVLNTVSFGVVWQPPTTFCGAIDAGAVYVAEVELVTASAPELPGASVQFTGRLEVSVTVPFSP